MKFVLKTVFGGSLLLAGLYALLGTELVPFLTVGRDAVRETFLEMVDRHDLKLAQVERQLTQCSEAFRSQAEARYRLGRLADQLDEKMRSARATMLAEKSRLKSFQTRLVSTGTVYDQAGQPLANNDVAEQVKRCQQRIRSAQTRYESLSVIREPCGKRLALLERACEEAPQRIQMLRELCDDLKQKIQLAKEMDRWSDELQKHAPLESATPESIEMALAEIDEDISSEMAGITAVLSLEEPGDLERAPLQTDSLIQQIELALVD